MRFDFIQLEKHKDNKRVVKNYSFESIYSLIKLLLLPLFLCHHNSYMLGKLCVEALADDIEGRFEIPGNDFFIFGDLLISLLAFDVFLFGTAISTPPRSKSNYI